MIDILLVYFLILAVCVVAYRYAFYLLLTFVNVPTGNLPDNDSEAAPYHGHGGHDCGSHGGDCGGGGH
jgi:hypothetical protein